MRGEQYCLETCDACGKRYLEQDGYFLTCPECQWDHDFCPECGKKFKLKWGRKSRPPLDHGETWSQEVTNLPTSGKR